MKFMYWRHKVYAFLICVFVGHSVSSNSLIEDLQNFISFKINAEKIFDAVNKDIVGKLKAGNIKFILPNHVEIDDMEVLDEEGERVLYSKHVRLTLSLLSLLTSNIRITEAYIDSPYFRYTIHNSVHNVVKIFESPKDTSIPAPKTPEPSSKMRVTVEHVRVDNGNFEMFHDAGVEIFAEGIKTEGHFFVADGPFGIDISEVTIERGGIITGAMDLPITDLIAKNLWISDEKVSTESMMAFYEKAKVTGSGTVFIDEDRYDIAADVDAPFGTYPRGLKPLPFVVPAFLAHATLLGPLEEPEIEVDVKLGVTDFNGLKINGGRAHCQINPHQINVEAAVIRVGVSGSLSAHGMIDIDKGNYRFFSSQKNILAEELAVFLSFDRKTHGFIDGRTQLNGNFSGRDQVMHIISSGKITDGAIENINLFKESDFDFDIRLVLEKELKINHASLKDASGLSALFSGQADFVSEEFHGNFDLYCTSLAQYFSLPLESDFVKGLEAKGNLSLDKKDLVVNSTINAASFSLAKIVGTKLKGKLRLNKNDLRINDISAQLYDGTLHAQLTVMDLDDKKLLNGTAVLRQVNINPLARSFFDLSLGGKLSSSLKIAGSFDMPHVSFVAEMEDFLIDQAMLKSVQVNGQFGENRLSVAKLEALINGGSIEGENLFLDVPTKKIGGSLMVSDLNIPSVLSKYFDQVDGDLSGPINIEGTFSSPEIVAPLLVEDLSIYGVKLGDGACTLAFAKRPLLDGQKLEDLVFSISSNLRFNASSSIARIAVALNKKTINADVKFNDVEVNTALVPAIKGSFGIAGRISGSIIAEGFVRAPVLKAELQTTEYGFFNSERHDAVLSIQKTYGPAVFSLGINKGILNLDACVSFLPSTGGYYCQEESSLTFNLRGPFNLDEYSLALTGKIDHEHFEEVLLPLKNELATLDVGAQFKGKLRKKIKEPVSVYLTTRIDRINASLPKVPHIKLEKPVSLTILNDSVELENEARFDFSPGSLTLHGSFSPSVLDVHLNGAIPLIFSRLFFPIIESADGLAKGNLTLSGSPKALQLEGSIVPEAPSSISLRKWLDPIEIREGGISFTPTSRSSFSTKLDNIKLAIGDGRLFINGNFETSHETKKAASFNLELIGSNIVVRDRLNFMEADFKIATERRSDGLIVKGDIVVTDGSVHQQFDLRNFVAEAQVGGKPDALKNIETMDLGLDLDIAVRQFRASARMLNLDIDTLLRGQMTLVGPMAHPKFKGALFVSEGAISFPSSVSFDLMETQIVLDENSSRVFDPKIEIVSTQELEKAEFPQISVDTSVELTLRGGIDRLALGLRPTRGDMQLSQLRIFLLLLSPRSFEGDEKDQFERIKRGAQSAAMAFSGEVFLRPLTNELQELLEGKTKTRIQFGSAIEAGGLSLRMNWKLGPRVEILGSYMFLTEEARRDANFYDNQVLGDLKLKLLLFDHRPFGPLSLESSFGSKRQELDGRDEPRGLYEPRGELRLKYRVLSQ